MGREELEFRQNGVVKRKVKRRMGLFIDAVGLDRATRRLERKVDLAGLVKGLTSGIPLEIARYYTLVPYEDDARQFAFLDAVERAGLEVVVKRLPPKGVKRQVSMDVHIASDLVSFCFGHHEKSEAEKHHSGSTSEAGNNGEPKSETIPVERPEREKPLIKRVATVVCPSRETTYAIFTAHTLGVETALADFGLYGASDGWKGVDRWIDLSTSETIWRN